VPYQPNLGHIGQTLNARGCAYATCCALQTLVARQCKGRGFLGKSTADVLLTKPPARTSGGLSFLRILQAKKRADERTRTADLLQLRVRSHAFSAVSRGFKNRLQKPCLLVLRFWMFPNARSGYCHGYCQNARLGYST
jgi:hypothetical protein